MAKQCIIEDSGYSNPTMMYNQFLYILKQCSVFVRAVYWHFMFMCVRGENCICHKLMSYSYSCETQPVEYWKDAGKQR